MKKLIILSFFYLISCSTVPMTGRKQLVAIPSSQIIALSGESYAQVLQEAQISSNAQYRTSVQKVGEKLTRAVEAYLVKNDLEEYLDGA